jgi:hypothetical protein
MLYFVYDSANLMIFPRLYYFFSGFYVRVQLQSLCTAVRITSTCTLAVDKSHHHLTIRDGGAQRATIKRE